MDYIRFYKISDDFGFLSNFAPYRVFTEGCNWPTSEHFFQASKFTDEAIKEKIRLIESPMKAAEEGRSKKNPLRVDWEEIKVEKMAKAIKCKFTQHHILKVKLLATNDDILIEHTVNDSYWGDGGDGSGKNMLGILLMDLRVKLKEICPVEWVLPPWLAFPEINELDMFWRMGLGEGYMYGWITWFNSQSIETQMDYRKMFEPSNEWENFYK